MASLLPVPIQMFFNPVTGLPVSLGRVYTYAAGTNTPKAAFSDQAGTVPLTNPIVLDANGVPISSVGGTRVHVWVDGSYKYVVQDSSGLTVDTVDNVTAFVAGGVNTIDINGLTPNASPATDDYIPTYDTSATANRKVAISDIIALVPTPASSASTLSAVLPTTSGTQISPGSNTVPAGTKRIAINFMGVSTNGTSLPIIRFVTSGTPATSGYVGSATKVNVANSLYTTGFTVNANHAAADIISGTIVLTKVDNLTGSPQWTCAGTIGLSNTAQTSITAGHFTSPNTPVTEVFLTTVNGTDTFDAGAISILYSQ